MCRKCHEIFCTIKEKVQYKKQSIKLCLFCYHNIPKLLLYLLLHAAKLLQNKSIGRRMESISLYLVIELYSRPFSPPYLCCNWHPFGPIGLQTLSTYLSKYLKKGIILLLLQLPLAAHSRYGLPNVEKVAHGL